MSLAINVFPKGQLTENTYVIKNDSTGECVVVDPGYYGEDIQSLIGGISNLRYIILTHGHFDHFYAIHEVKADYPFSKFVAPEKEKYLMSKDWVNDYLSRGYNAPLCPQADIYVKEGDTLKFGDYNFEFIETPGHTEGGMCVKINNFLFSGDTLFKLSVGNSNLETGNWDQLVESINTKLFTLDDDVMVLPGHGSATTIGYEKRSNPFV